MSMHTVSIIFKHCKGITGTIARSEDIDAVINSQREIKSK